MNEAGSWNNLHERVEVKRINHQEAYLKDNACTNWAEEFFSRMCCAEIGIHHHIAAASLLRYAQDSSWREDNRRLSNGEQVNRLAALSLKCGESVDFGGYWQRHIERCSCLSKSFTPTKKCLKIMSPVNMTKPYFVSECRVAGFIRTLLSGLVRSIKTT
jgi:hypothetical protein